MRPRSWLGWTRAARSILPARRAALRRLLGVAGLYPAELAAEQTSVRPPGERLDVIGFGAVPGALDRPGRDSTDAIQRAIDTVSAAGGGEVRIPAGVFWIRGIAMAPRVTLVGTGWGSVLKLLPGSDQHVIRASANRRSSDGGCTDEMYAIANLAIDGNRDGQSHDWWGDGIHLDMTFDNDAIPNAPTNLWRVHDHHHVFERLLIKDCKRDGIFIRGKGGHTGSHLHIGQCTRFGLNLRSYDNLWSHLYIGGIGADGVRVGAGPNHFTCCKTFFTGQATQNLLDSTAVAGTGVAPEDWRFGAGWVFGDGGAACVLTSCEVQDSWGHGVVLLGSEVVLMGMRLGNIGSLGKRFGLGRQPPPPEVAAIWLGPNATDNVVEGLVADQFTRYRGDPPNASLAVGGSPGAQRNRLRLKVVPGHVLSPTAPETTPSGWLGLANELKFD
jgi:hypothetical protein